MMNNNRELINDLYLFYRLFIASNYNDSVPAPHIKVLSRKLMNLKLGEGKKRLCVSMPPRHSKSSMVTLAYPLWLFLQDPNLNIMIITGSKSLAEKFGIQLREQFKKIGSFFNLYLSDVNYSNTHLMFCDSDKKLYNGNIMLFTSGGGFTGNDADFLILDDPYKGDDREFTPTALQKKIDWVNRVVEQRIEPHTRYCVLHTRWHSKDIIGNYESNYKDQYDFISFPALDKYNRPLWVERYTAEELLSKKEQVGERIFNSVYQQKPIDMTSDFFNMKNIHYNLPSDFNTTFCKCCRAWDIASADSFSKKDRTAGALLYRVDDKAVLKGLVHGRFGSGTKQKIRDTAFNDGFSTDIIIETGVAAAGDLLYQEWSQQLSEFNVERAKVPGSKSKADRATPLKNAIQDGKFYIDIEGEEYDSLIEEFESFPNGEFDDIVDAVAHGYNYLFNTDGHNAMLGVINL